TDTRRKNEVVSGPSSVGAALDLELKWHAGQGDPGCLLLCCQKFYRLRHHLPARFQELLEGGRRREPLLSSSAQNLPHRSLCFVGEILNSVLRGSRQVQRLLYIRVVERAQTALLQLDLLQPAHLLGPQHDP